MSWLSEFRVDAKAPRRKREGSEKEAASAADAPGTGIEKGCIFAAFFPVPGAATDLSLITNGIRLVLFDNELVHCQKIDILMEVFMIILE